MEKVLNKEHKVQFFNQMVEHCLYSLLFPSLSSVRHALVSITPSIHSTKKKAAWPDTRSVTMEIFNNVPSSQWQPSVHQRLNEVHTLHTSEGYGKNRSMGFQKVPGSTKTPPTPTERPHWTIAVGIPTFSSEISQNSLI